jgi:hypothetical protein
MDSLDLSHVTVQSISNQQFSIPIKVETVENTEEITALIDSGAKGLFIDKSIAHKWRTSMLKSPIKVRNVDGTYNKNGAITDRCLCHESQTETTQHKTRWVSERRITPDC